ncbi:MAG: superoxide dismutase, Ni [Candidatus Aenigmarchaeota archaeon]|nr:superoxide dismutase, Ni [Candidatus Aenigmarchaeota archaeon]
MSALHSFFRFAEQVHPFQVASAHCDVPCGIYDPHTAQIAAHTVIRMIQLIQDMHEPITPAERLQYAHAIARYTAVKEEHAERCKQEIRILWGDYFKPEHLKQFPELHDLVWKVMKLGSKARQGIDMNSAQELLATIQQIAVIFWKTKELETVRMKAPYPSGGEIILPR